MRHPLALVLTMAATPAFAQDVPRVVTDFAVTQSLVQMVLGDLGQAEALVPAGGNAHSFQMRPSQAQALEGADVIVWMGPEMTGWMERALEGLGGGAHRVSLLAVDGIVTRQFGQEDGHDDHGHSADAHKHDSHGHDHGKDAHKHDSHGHDHGKDAHKHDDHGHDHGTDAHKHDDHGHDHSADAHKHDDHAGHDHDDDHAHTGLDPHAWMNTGNAALWLDAIAAELAEHDAANAATYAANAAAAKATLAALETELAATLAPAADMPIMVFHDAYNYLAAQFDLHIAGSIALGDATDPGAQRIAELRATLAQEGAVCVFPEVNHSSRYITLVLEGTNVKLGAELDPEGAKLAPGADLYPTLMRNLARDIAECVTR
jgi:zinc transport system substrate-binding protein